MNSEELRKHAPYPDLEPTTVGHFILRMVDKIALEQHRRDNKCGRKGHRGRPGRQCRRCGRLVPHPAIGSGRGSGRASETEQ